MPVKVATVWGRAPLLSAVAPGLLKQRIPFSSRASFAFPQPESSLSSCWILSFRPHAVSVRSSTTFLLIRTNLPL